MKKAILLILALALVLSLAACGGKDNNDPLNREGGSSNTPGTSQGENNTPSGGAQGNVPDLSGLIGGNQKLSDLNAAERQAMIDAAKADGVTVEFKSDGSVVITEADGSKSIQKPDGSWTFEDEDGQHDVQIGGGWPDNEYTKMLPKPGFSAANGASTDESGFSISFSDATLEKVKAYVEQVKAKGFTVDEETMDENYGGMAVYSYTASNANGYRVEVTFSSGQSVISIMKP